MNILYFHPHFTYPGGAGKFVLETGERLAKMGHNVTILAQSGDPEIIKNYSSIKFKFIGGPLPNTISHWVQFPLLMKRVFEATKYMDIDVIFPQVFPANYWGFLFKKKYSGIPCVWFCHEPSAFVHNYEVIYGLNEPMKTLALVSNPIMKQIDKFLMNSSDKILTNSLFSSHNIKRVYNRDSIVIYPGVDISKFKPVERKENYIFSIGRLTKFKRMDLLLKSMVHLKDKNLHLYIGGDGEEKNNLILMSKELGISDSVTFLGKIPESQLNSYYSKAKAVIFPTIGEPFGIVPIEAMASGTPVIAGICGGVVESVKDGVTGYLVDPTDTESLVLKINDLITNPDLCSQMSNNSRAHIEKNFTWDITAKKIHEFFYSL
ncbi:MAG: glycosyltransferase family 4 protein [Euryarchaeota archaeon]|nr:glycosyltransferase family 4 protein [Euryarchaeota archaeon]